MSIPRVSVILASIVVLSAAASADERLEGIACRSVHLNYPAPAGTAFANELTVDRSAPGTYFCVCGFNHGYFGLQELGDGKKVLLFSVWDPGAGDDPNAVPADQRVRLVAKDEAVRVGRFGNEGTGGQAFLDFDWKVGATYRFLVTAAVEGDRTLFTGYFAPPDAPEWRRLVAFSTLTAGKPLSGYYSFIEDFRRDRVSATRERQARFGNGWARGTDGRWTALTRARFTADRNPVTNIDALVAGDRFELATGGATKPEHVALNQEMDRPPTGLLSVPAVVKPDRSAVP